MNAQIDVSGFEKLQKAMREYHGNVEKTINDVLHNEAAPKMQESITRLIPVSSRKPWQGKKPHAKTSKSLTSLNGNLSVTVLTTKNYQYLYFPDDGTNTRRHVGNQQFFHRGGEAVQDEIVDRCVLKLINDFNAN